MCINYSIPSKEIGSQTEINTIYALLAQLLYSKLTLPASNKSISVYKLTQPGHFFISFIDFAFCIMIAIFAWSPFSVLFLQPRSSF